MKTILHVNRHTLAKNKKCGQNKPPLTVKTYKSNTYGHSVDIFDKQGNLIGRAIHDSKNPLKCGARVWLEFFTPIKIHKRYVKRNDTNRSRSCNLRSCNSNRTKT